MKKLLLSLLTVVPLMLIAQDPDPQPQLVYDINPNGDSGPKNFKAYNDILYFSADDGANGREIWLTDGTADGTHMLKNINPETGSSDPSGFAVFNGKLYFSADDGANGREIWLTDGTTTGTQLLKNIRSGEDSSDPSDFTVFEGMLYFSAYYEDPEGENGREIYVTDGTTGGTQLWYDISPQDGSDPSDFIEYDGKLFFSAREKEGGGGSSETGREIWITDGSSTHLFKDLNPGERNGNPSGFTAFNGKLYFQANDGSSSNNELELWVTDGTVPGTQLLKDIDPGGTSDPRDFTVLNNYLFFTAKGPGDNRELWVTDGSSTGTIMFKDINPSSSSNPEDLIVCNETLYFRANEGTNGVELWKTDGTLMGTQKVAPNIAANSNPLDTDGEFTVYNDNLFFGASYTSVGNELYFLANITEVIEINGVSILSALYPNPAKEETSLSFSGGLPSVMQLEVYDVSGKLVLSDIIDKSSKDYTVKLTGWAAGIYFLQLREKNGLNIKTFKLIKSRD